MQVTSLEAQDRRHLDDSRGRDCAARRAEIDGDRPGRRRPRRQPPSRSKSSLAEGSRVVAVDPFYFGESKIKSKDFLFALLVSSVGERPLGVQASQLGAIARWLSDDRKAGDVTLVAVGPRTSLIALAAAAIEDKAIASVDAARLAAARSRK